MHLHGQLQRIHLLSFSGCGDGKCGRAPMAAPAWERMGFDMNSPIYHPQQDFAELAGIAGAGENLGAELHAEV